MALKDLSTQQMVHITGAWLDPKRQRSRIEALPRVASLLPDIQEAHDGVRKVQRKDTTRADELADVQEQQANVDKVHDRKARGTHAVLTGYADLADDPEDAAFYVELRDEIFPNGLRFITGGYGDEAGETHLARERLTPEMKAALKALLTPGGTLLKAVLAWLAAGEELGGLEERRAKLEAEASGQKGSTPQGNHARARNYWIKVMRAVLQMMELEKLDAKAEIELLAPLQRALAKAERRGAGGKDGSSGDQVVEGEAVEDEAAEDAAVEDGAEKDDDLDAKPKPPKG